MKDRVYLAGTLASHRRSRLLVQLLDAVAVDEQSDGLPEHGICMLVGKEYQESDPDVQRTWQEWYQRPGRTLLLIPPYSNGPVQKITAGVDWTLGFCSDGVKGMEGSIAEYVAGEVVFSLQSELPVFLREAGHLWQDYSFNTLFAKSHSGTGVFAATTLPLWSISLLSHQKELQNWLELLHEQAGAAITESGDEASSEDSQVVLENKDWTVLACIYAYSTTGAAGLLRAISAQPFPLFSFEPEWLEASFERLHSFAYLESGGITELGLSKLQEGPWYQYARMMKEAL